MQPLRILAIDDDRLIGMAIQSFTQDLGHRCVHCENGAEGLARYQQEKFDLVLVDRMMPGMDGLEVTHQLREIQKNSTWYPILMLSGANDIEDQIHALNSGCDDFLAKPINFSILEAKINSFWRIAQLQHEVARQHEALLEYANREAEERRLASFLMERLIHRDRLQHPRIQHLLQPARGDLSGDLLLVCRSRSDDVYVMLADATGHGLPAAITLIPLSRAFYAMAAKGFQLGSIVHELNEQHRAHCPADHFVAALAARYSPSEGTLQVWNGGIPAALLLTETGSIHWRFSSLNLPLGIVPSSEFNQEVETVMLPLKAQLCMYSDGLIEAEAPDGQPLGKEALELVLTQAPLEQRLEALNRAVNKHLQGMPAHDDLSCLLLDCSSSNHENNKPTVASEECGQVENWGMQLHLTASQIKRLDLEPLISSFCQTLGLDSARQGLFALILRELLSNSLDHGLLGLDSQLKNETDGFERYVQLRSERLQALQQGSIHMFIEQLSNEQNHQLRIEVSDSGPGFDHQTWAASQRLNDSTSYHGRGLILLQQICSELIFLGNGNQVRAELRWSECPPTTDTDH